MSELWLATAPERPVVIPGAEQTLLYREAHKNGWAVIRRPIRLVEITDAGTVLIEHDELASMIGGLLHAMVYRLEQIGVDIPDLLLRATNDRPAGTIGAGEATLLCIDGHWHYVSSWRFGTYVAAVTVHDDCWVGLLAPQPNDLALTSIEDYRTISW